MFGDHGLEVGKQNGTKLQVGSSIVRIGSCDYWLGTLTISQQSLTAAGGMQCVDVDNSHTSAPDTTSCASMCRDHTFVTYTGVHERQTQGHPS